MADHVRQSGLLTPTRDRALALAWLASATVALVVVTPKLVTRPWMMDGRTFWSVWRVGSMYDLPPNQPGAYLYSPVFAQVIWPLAHLPWWTFSVLWFVMAVASYVWLVAPVGWLWAVPLLGLALEDVTIGNTAWMMALACVLGMRWPAAWAVPVMTKITTGVGLVWFVVRRDGRAVATVVVTCVVVATVSFLLAPDSWRQWVTFLSVHRGADSSLYVRVILAVLVVWFAARHERAWLIPVAMVIATPVLMVYALGMLCAIPRLLPPEVLARARAPFGTPVEFARRVLDLPQAA